MGKNINLIAVGVVRHDGAVYADGETITDVPLKQAEALLQVGAARQADAEHHADEEDGDAEASDGQAPAKAGKAAAGKKAR